VATSQNVRLTWAGLTAAVIACTILIGLSPTQSRRADTDARDRALGTARLVASRIDWHFSALEIILRNTSRAISLDPNDVDWNDAMLDRVKSELSGAIANIFLLTRDGRNIGNAVGSHASAGDREYFQRAMAGEPLVVGNPIRSRSNLGWVIPVAHPIKNSAGEPQAVLAAATPLDGLREVIGVDQLPIGSVIRVVNAEQTEVTTISRDPAATGNDLIRLGSSARQFRLKEGTEIVTSHRNDRNVTLIVGFSTTHRAPWLITVGMAY